MAACERFRGFLAALGGRDANRCANRLARCGVRAKKPTRLPRVLSPATSSLDFFLERESDRGREDMQRHRQSSLYSALVDLRLFVLFSWQASIRDRARDHALESVDSYETRILGSSRSIAALCHGRPAVKPLRGLHSTSCYKCNARRCPLIPFVSRPFNGHRCCMSLHRIRAFPLLPAWTRAERCRRGR